MPYCPVVFPKIYEMLSNYIKTLQLNDKKNEFFRRAIAISAIDFLSSIVSLVKKEFIGYFKNNELLQIILFLIKD